MTNSQPFSSHLVVYFVTSPQTGLIEIPLLLKGEVPTSASAPGGTNVGTGNLSIGAPKAIVVGITYDNAWIAAAHKEIAAAGKHIPILKPDVSAGGAAAPSAEKAKVVAERAVKVLRKLEEEGKLDGGDDGIYSY